MKRFPWKSRRYPIIRDEYGRSARQQAFDYFAEGYRPAQIFKQELIPVPIETLFRYYEDWKKQKHRVSRSILRKYLKEKSEFSEKYIKMLADYFGVSEEQITIRMQKPWGITSLSKGELPDNRLYRIQSEVEERLEAALRLIYLGEQLCRNPPKQIKRFLAELIILRDNTTLTISRVKGQIEITKNSLDGER